MKRFVTAFAVCMIACVAQVASAAVFFTDAFEYADGQLTSTVVPASPNPGTGDNVSGGLWTAHSGTGVGSDVNPEAQFVQVSGGKAQLSFHGREDVNRLTNVTMGAGDEWFYAIKFSVADLDENLNVVNDYFAHFMIGGANLRGRLYIDLPKNGGTDFTLGLSSSSGGQTVNWATDFAFDTEIVAVVSYDFDSGLSKFWVNPVDVDSTNLADPTPNSNSPMQAINALGLRQGSVGGTSLRQRIDVDAVAIGDDFAGVLAALGGGGGEFAAADFNENGAVDGTDLGIWAGGYGLTGAPKSSGDATGEGDVDGADFLVWQREYTGTPAVGAVPEPTAVGLVLVGLAVLARRKK